MVSYDLEAKVKWVSKKLFIGHAREHSVIIDQPAEFGGENIGFKPRELLLIALGGCLGTRIVSLLEETGIEVEGLEIDVKYSELKQSITANIIVQGTFNDDEREVLEKIIEEAEKRCIVTRMLRDKTTVIVQAKLR